LAESTFDRHAFAGSLGTLRIGRSLYTRAEVDSTNDWAWRALASGAEDGAAFVADRQRAGRGREGRAWHTTPGKGLALSLLLTLERPPRAVGVVPLAAGLALARGIERLGLKTRLKWPNDLLVGSSKLAGILCESRRTPRGAWAVVVGVGVNVSQQREEFPREVGEQATSLALEGCGASREHVAAELLNALEPLWDVMATRGAEPVLEAWRARATFWGQPVTVRSLGRAQSGIATGLDDGGGLMLDQGGRTVVVLAGDLDVGAASG